MVKSSLVNSVYGPIAPPKSHKIKPTTISSQPMQLTKLQKMVSKNPHFTYLYNGKLKCLLTDHYFLPTLVNYISYLSSKSYLRGLESDFNLYDYGPYLVYHHENAHFLYCRLTGVKLPRRKSVVDKHVQGKRFVMRKEEVEKEEEMKKREKEEKEERAEKLAKRRDNKRKKQKFGQYNGVVEKNGEYNGQVYHYYQKMYYNEQPYENTLQQPPKTSKHPKPKKYLKTPKVN